MLISKNYFKWKCFIKPLKVSDTKTAVKMSGKWISQKPNEKIFSGT